jgi:hypothetical protein
MNLWLTKRSASIMLCFHLAQNHVHSSFPPHFHLHSANSFDSQLADTVELKRIIFANSFVSHKHIYNNSAEYDFTIIHMETFLHQCVQSRLQGNSMLHKNSYSSGEIERYKFYEGSTSVSSLTASFSTLPVTRFSRVAALSIAKFSWLILSPSV